MSADLSSVLKSLLGQSAVALRGRERTLWDERVSLNDPVVLFGAGGLGQKVVDGARKLGLRVVAFADNSSERQGSTVGGLPVFSLRDAASRYGASATFVSAVFMDSDWSAFKARRAELAALGCRNVQPFYPLFWKFPEQFLPHYTYDLPHKVIEAGDGIQAAWDLLSDQSSRGEFLAQIAWRLNPEFEDLPPAESDEIYFPPDLVRLHADEVFVDCGAYSGDTLRSFIRQSRGNFKRTHVFEPDPRNFEKLRETITQLPEDIAARIRTGQLAIGRSSGSVHMNAQGAASSAITQTGEFVVRCEPLDAVLDGEAATFIKMDVEGAEMDLLHGAETQIKKHHPLMAISVYHRQEHLWEALLFVHSIFPEYRYFLRRYSPVAFDDLVLFAVPPNR